MQYTPNNMLFDDALLCFVLFCLGIQTYSAGLLYWQWGNHVPVKQPWRMWVDIYIQSPKTDNINTTHDSMNEEKFICDANRDNRTNSIM